MANKGKKAKKCPYDICYAYFFNYDNYVSHIENDHKVKEPSPLDYEVKNFVN